LLIGSFASLSSTFAAQFPGSGPLRLIAGASPGSVADLLARAIGEQLSLNLRVPVIVENKAGASGVLASQAVLAAPADGMTLLVLSNALVINPFVIPVEFDPIRDFRGVAHLGSMPHLLVVPQTSPYHSVAELIAGARAKSLTFASAGIGSASHFAAEKFAMAARIDSVHVPFKNAVDAVTATVTGQIDWLVAAPVGAVTEWIRTQRLVALAVTAPTRFPALPNVPTLAQSGIGGADSTIWAGLFVSSRTPREIIARLNSATLAALQSKVAQAQLLNLGAESQPLTPEEFDALVLREYESARDVAKAAKISVK
jgi:tripartite-type tricarboxylate transporter receptor subunit TctC